MLLFSALPVQGALFQRPQITRAAPELPQPPKNAMLTMRVDEERISAVIADTSLQTVLGELAARTGTIFEVRSHENPLVSVRLDRVSLQEAIQRIAPGSNAIYFYGQNQAAPQRIALVRLFPRIDTSPQPSILYLGTGAITKGNDTADTPEQALIILAESANVEARGRAVDVLVDSGDDRAIKALLKAVSDASPQIRVSAIEGLAALNAHAALPNILRCLKDSSPAVRRSAATAVALLGTVQNIKDLKPLGKDRDAGVVAAADTAIRKLTASVKK